jgi:hypothetical protein
MRYKYLCVAATLASALLGDAALHRSDATGSRVGKASGSPVLVINMRTYRWRMPEFRMAGQDAYALVQVENTHDYAVEMFVDCRTPDGRIPKMSGYYIIGPKEFLHMDTRRMRDPLQKGDGVKVNCRFRADGSAKVEAWVYDEVVHGES